MIAEEGKAGRNVGEKWSAKMVPSPAASDSNLGRPLRRFKFITERAAMHSKGQVPGLTSVNPDARPAVNVVIAVLEVLVY
jgi:hypothetical protein